MTTQHDKAKRWRPRFSVRTLVVVVTLVCAYFGLWEATKTWGIRAAVPEPTRFIPPYSPCPFVIVEPASTIMINANVAVMGGYDRRDYFWFFGYIRQLGDVPYE